MEGDLKRNETVSPMAGKTPSQEMLVDVTRLEREYFERLPDVGDPTQLVSLGTSGHRGSSLRGSFNEAHGRSMTPRRRPLQFSFLLQPNKSLFTKLVNLRVARHRTLTESSTSQPVPIGTYIAQSKQ